MFKIRIIISQKSLNKEITELLQAKKNLFQIIHPNSQDTADFFILDEVSYIKNRDFFNRIGYNNSQEYKTPSLLIVKTQPRKDRFYINEFKDFNYEILNLPIQKNDLEFLTYKLMYNRKKLEEIEMKRQYNNLLSSVELFLSNTNEVIFVTDETGNVIKANRQFEIKKQKEIIGKNLKEVYPNDAHKTILDKFNIALQTNTSTRFILKYRGFYIIKIIPIVLINGKKGALIIEEDISRSVNVTRFWVLRTKILEILIQEKEVEIALKRIYKLISRYYNVHVVVNGNIINFSGEQPYSINLEINKVLDRKTLDKGTGNLIRLDSEAVKTLKNLTDLDFFSEESKIYLYLTTVKTVSLFLLFRFKDELTLTEEKRVSVLCKELNRALLFIEQELIIERSFNQTRENIVNLATSIDHIRNPLSIILAYIEQYDESPHRQKIFKQIQRIDSFLNKLELGWIKSEDISKFFTREKEKENTVK